MRFAFFAGLTSVFLVGAASAESITGQYLEARNASMWAGPCVVNSEMGIVGDKATLAWKVTKGAYQNVRLDGLAIVALVFGDRTFGIGDQVHTRTIFVVDDRADEAQQAALVRMATALAGDTIQQVIAIKRARIRLDIADGGSGYCFLDAGLARIRTRHMHRTDSLCGTVHTRMVYPTLAKVTDERPAFTLENIYSGSQLEVKAYEDRNVPSAVVAKFSL